MKKTRIVARFDIKPPALIKPIGLDGVRRVGDPIEYVRRYLQQGVDEILLLNVVASLYGLDLTASLVSDMAKLVNVPVSVGGGLRSLSDVDLLMRSGADKIVLNTACHENNRLVSDIANKYGSQAVIVSLQARSVGDDIHLFRNAGRDYINVDWKEYLSSLIDRGAGEVMLTSIDYDGKMRGMDMNLISRLNEYSSIPIIVSSGLRSADCIDRLFARCVPEAIAVGASLHYNKVTIDSLKDRIRSHGIFVRSAD